MKGPKHPKASKASGAMGTCKSKEEVQGNLAEREDALKKDFEATLAPVIEIAL